jgi:predicted nucleic acid-binding protein
LQRRFARPCAETLLDSSAFAKRYVEEPGSEAVESLCLAASELGLCVVCVPEILSAMNRRLRERRLNRAQYAQIKQRLLEDIADADIVEFTPPVIAATVTVLEASVVRAADAMHVAAAVVWGAELFVSSDRQQLAAARKAGLRVKAV